MSKFKQLLGLTACVCVFAAQGQALAQGVLRTVTFDGQPPGTAYAETYYYVDSVTFVPMQTNGYFTRAGNARPALPENGTAYLLFGFGDPLSGSRQGSRFRLYSVDLAEFSILYNFPATIEFIGYRPDGKVVDWNIAHKEIDLKNWKGNLKNSGFLPEERAWVDRYLEHGFVDAYRRLYPERVQYTWWTYRMNARQNGVG